MNRKLVGHLLGAILLIEAACMVPALVVALIYQDEDVWAMGKAILLLAAIGAPDALRHSPAGAEPSRP